MIFIRTIVLIYLVFPTDISALWWARGGRLTRDVNAICRRSRRVGSQQQDMCSHETEIVRQVSLSVGKALNECQFQFRNRHWNCTTEPRRVVAKLLKMDTREASFLHSIVAAGALHAVAEGCSQGRLLACSCDNTYRRRNPADRPPPSSGPPATVTGSNEAAAKDEWSWGGCTDDVAFAYAKSKQFIDVESNGRKGNDFRTMVHAHNHEAGRLASKRYIRRACKCHGLSGSCTMRTCVKQVPTFSDVGERLKQRFDGAIQVTVSNDDGQRLQPAVSQGYDTRPYSDEDLVYSDASPNYCERNRRLGSLGTRGRVCDPDSMGVDGCGILCCDRGYRAKMVTVVENCQCKFHWCCEVICQTCFITKTIHKCR